MRDEFSFLLLSELDKRCGCDGDDPLLDLGDGDWDESGLKGNRSAELANLSDDVVVFFEEPYFSHCNKELKCFP